MRKIADFDTIRTEIQSHLGDYLSEMVPGFSDHSFRCISPLHEDNNPSANIVPQSEGTHWKCHGCGASGDIFTAAHLLESKPLNGSDFIHENLMHLAEKYSIEVPLAEMSEHEIWTMKARRAFQLVATALLEQEPSPLFHNEISRRGWSEADCRAAGIWQVSDTQAFFQKLEDLGLGQDMLEDLGLNDPWQFGPERMLFSLHDESGALVGFTARNLRFEAEREAGVANAKKFKNTTNTRLFTKRTHLYNLHVAKEYRDRVVYLVEGHPDVAAARFLGHTPNIVAIGGNSFTEDHVLALRSAGIRKICITMDGDASGQAKVPEIIETLSRNPGLDVTVLTLPPASDEKDVDAFIRKWGEQAWHEAKRTAVTAFAWMLKQRTTPIDDDFVRAQIDLIANEEDHIRSYRMLKELAQAANYPEAVLERQLQTQRDAKHAEYESRLVSIGHDLGRTLLSNPSAIQGAIASAEQRLSGLQREFKNASFDPERQARRIQLLEERQREMTFDDGLRTGWPLFDRFTFGIPPEDTLIFIGGKANAGKTSLVANMAARILDRHDDTIVLVYTIDDNIEKFVPRMVGAIAGIPVQWVRKPTTTDPCYLPYEKPGVRMSLETMLAKRKHAYEKLDNWATDGRLIMWDAADSPATWEFVDSQLRTIRERFPKQRIVLFLDNFHNLQDAPEMDPTPRAGYISGKIIQSIAKHRITAISTVEYTKLNDRVKPTNRNLADSRRMEYAADMIVHLVNHAHEFRTAPNKLLVKWLDPLGWNASDIYPEERPVIEMMVGKSKISSFKGSIFYRFHQDNCSFEECSEEEQARFHEDGNKQPWITDQR